MTSKMKFNLIIVITTLMLINLASAVDYSYIFEQNRKAEINVMCITNQSLPCDNTIKTNITINYPNGTIFISDKPMSFKESGVFNYTLNQTQTRILGEYSVLTYANGTIAGFSTFSFKITPSGEELSTSGGIVYFLFLVAGIFVFILFLYGAIKIQWKHNRDMSGRIVSVNDLRYLKILLIAFSYIILMFIFGITRSITANYVTLAGASKMFGWLYWLMFSALWPLIVVSLLITVINYLSAIKLKEAIFRRVPIR